MIVSAMIITQYNLKINSFRSKTFKKLIFVYLYKYKLLPLCIITIYITHLYIKLYISLIKSIVFIASKVFKAS